MQPLFDEQTGAPLNNKAAKLLGRGVSDSARDLPARYAPYAKRIRGCSDTCPSIDIHR